MSPTDKKDDPEDGAQFDRVSLLDIEPDEEVVRPEVTPPRPPKPPPRIRPVALPSHPAMTPAAPSVALAPTPAPSGPVVSRPAPSRPPPPPHPSRPPPAPPAPSRPPSGGGQPASTPRPPPAASAGVALLDRPSVPPPGWSPVPAAAVNLLRTMPLPGSGVVQVSSAGVSAAPVLDIAGQVRGELRRRADRLQGSDPVGAARVLVELGLAEERGDVAAARGCYEQARGLSPSLLAALIRRRRLVEGRGEHVLQAIDDELKATTGEGRRADLFAERARACHALSRLSEARAAYQEALRLVPLHAASLRGLLGALEDELAQGPSKPLAAELEAHLARLTAAYHADGQSDGDARLSAWLHIERAALLDARLGQPDQALAALRRAVALQPLPGPVRDALARFHVTHKQEAGLCDALVEEAEFETDNDRSARLLYMAARIRTERLKQPNEAVSVLLMALRRSPVGGVTSRRVLLELSRLHEEAGRLEDAASTRGQLLAYASEPLASAHEHIRLFELLSALGRTESAAQQARYALQITPEDPVARERLDATLATLGKHEDRVALWLEVTRSDQPPEARIEALIRAAEIAEHALGRPQDAIAHLRSAWALAPGQGRIFDALAALLTPPPREADDARGVQARLALYSEAARAAEDPARRIAMLEKIASIWEDELFQPARVAEELNRVLDIDPQRRTAILALQRNAARAGNAALLVRSLVLEADTTADPALKRRLLLRAAEVTRDRLNDRAAAFLLLERAEALDPVHPDALQARAAHARLASRPEDARKALQTLIARHPRLDLFSLWIEVALLDEHHRKNPRDAVASYRQAARIKPTHPAPPREIARLLRQLGDARTLVESLTELASMVPSVDEQIRLLVEAAELQELSLADDDGALRSLAKAASLKEPAEPLIHEMSERILLRRGLSAELIALYRRWLAENPPLVTRQRVRVALALMLQDSQRPEAIEALTMALGEGRELMPALRLLRHLHRRARAFGPLAALLESESAVLKSGLARRGALWELAALEHSSEEPTLVTLERIAREDPRDGAALDGAARLAGRLLARGEAAAAPRLRAALQARRALVDGGTEHALFLLEEGLVREREPDAEASTGALGCYRAALADYPGSLLAARCLARLATQAGDREALVLAETALGSLVDVPAEQAEHLVNAADLVRGLPGQRAPIELYEQALACDPDCTSAATNLAALLASEPARLVERLSAALEHARSPAQILLLGSEIGRTVLLLATSGAEGPSPQVGIQAVQRALAHDTNAPRLLMLRARLEAAGRLWPEARSTLIHLLATSPTPEAQIPAYFELAALYQGPMEAPDKAQDSLQALLTLDPRNRRALEALRQLGQERGDLRLVISALTRLADQAHDATSRVDYNLHLADAYLAANDASNRVAALCEAILSAGPDPRPWDALARTFRLSTQEGAAAYAESLAHLVRTATERGVPVAPRWLSTLGLLEATTLFKHAEALDHLRQATMLPGATADERAALGQGLEASGRNGEAIRTLRELVAEGDGLLTLSSPGATLAVLEAALAKEGRTEEQLPVQEVRACLGHMPEDWVSAMRTRKLPLGAPMSGSLTGPDLQRLLHPGARGAMLAVSAALSPIAAKVLGFSLPSLGLTSRERLSPRDGHPTRVLADRLARALGIESFELYLAASWQSPIRAYPGDPPLIVAPASFADLPELEQAAALTRYLFRIAVGLPFLDDMPAESLDGLLFAALCAAEPTMSSFLSAPRERAMQAFLAPVQKAIGRRQRKQIEEVAASVPTTFDIAPFLVSIRLSEQQFPYLLTGALISCIDALRRSSASDVTLLRQPLAINLLRYSMTETAVVERWRIGSTWTERRQPL